MLTDPPGLALYCGPLRQTLYAHPCHENAVSNSINSKSPPNGLGMRLLLVTS